MTTERPGSQVPPGRTGLSLVFDVVAVLSIAGAWWLFLQAITHGRPFVFYDSFRDIAYASNILAGRIWADPLVAGQPPWYPPGGPLLLAGIAAITAAEPIDVYAGSAWWLNVLLPVLAFVVVRVAVDRVTALLAVPLIALGSLWWVSHLPAPMASVQGMVFGLAGLLLWQRFGHSGLGAAGVGGWLGLTAWVHPLCALLPLCGVLGSGIIAAARGTVRALWRAGVCAAATVVVAAPLAAIVLVSPLNNPTPTRYFASELRDVRHALQLHAPAVPLLGLLGIALVLFRGARLSWLPGYFVAAGVGQALGYAAVGLGWPLPYVLPHQFQWHGHWALGIGAALACSETGRVVAARVCRRWRGSGGETHGLAASGLAIALAAIAVLPALDEWARGEGYVQPLRLVRGGERELLARICADTPPDATIVCEPDVGYRLIAPRTARKLVAAREGHMNPRLDAARRLADLERLLATESEPEFLRLARSYGAGWLAVVTTSPDDAAPLRARFDSWAALRLAWQDRQGELLLYRVVAVP